MSRPESGWPASTMQATPSFLASTSSFAMSDTSDHVDASFNEIRYEDEKEKEYIYLQAQRDMQRLVIEQLWRPLDGMNLGDLRRHYQTRGII